MKTSISRKFFFLGLVLGIIPVYAEFTNVDRDILYGIHDDTTSISSLLPGISDSLQWQSEIYNNTLWIHNIYSESLKTRSLVSDISKDSTNIKENTSLIQQYIYQLLQGMLNTPYGDSSNWLEAVYSKLFTSESALQEINTHADSIDGELSSSAEGSIKNLLQKIVDNTSGGSDGGDGGDGGSDDGTDETDTVLQSFMDLFNEEVELDDYWLIPTRYGQYNAKLDLKIPESVQRVSYTDNFIGHILRGLSNLARVNSQGVIVNQSANLNLQSIRTNLVQQLTQMQYWSTNYYAKMLVQMTNHIGVVKGENLLMKSPNNFRQDFDIDKIANYDNLEFAATGDFYEDIISLSHYQASAAKGRNYTLYSILTNVQIIANTIISKSPEELEGEDQISKSEEKIKETIEAAEEVENNSGTYIGFKNGISDLQNTASIEALQGGDNMPTEMTIIIPSWTFGDQGGLSEETITIDLSKIEPMVQLIRSGFGILYWGLAIFFVVWLWGHFRTLASKFIEFSSGLVAAGG